MRRRFRVVLATASLFALALLAVPGVAAGDPCYHGYTIPPSTSAATSTVNLDPCAFLPTNAEVAIGTTVTFVNRSSEAHLLTGANAEWGDRDQELKPGERVSVRFAEPGVYAYSCSLHRGMTGAVVVGKPGGAGDAAAATVATTGQDPGASDQQMLFVAVSLAVLASAGWTVALAQRKRVASRAT
jgi:plastocyanin